MVNLGGQSDDTPSTSLRDIYEVLYQQGYELSAEGDTNAELQHPIYNAIYFLAL